MYNEIPIIIETDKLALYSILRKPNRCNRVVILSPAPTGTRIGPQGIFVHLARKLYNSGIASFSFDLPTFGDSYFKNNEINSKIQYNFLYKETLETVVQYLKKNYAFDEYIFLSISFGCIPTFNYVLRNKFLKVVLLSPDHFLGNTKFKVDKKNLRTYLNKLSYLSFWYKLITLDLNVLKIIKNIFNVSSRSKKKLKTNLKNKGKLAFNSPVKILNVFGEKDDKLNVYKIYWKTFIQGFSLDNYQEEIIKNADHSYFGWNIKESVCELVTHWIKAN